MPNLPVAKYNDRYSLSTFSFAKSGSYGVEGTCHHKSNLGHVIMLEVEWVLSHFPIESIILHHWHKNAFGVYSRSCAWNANVTNTLSMERRKNFECWIFPNCILTTQTLKCPTMTLGSTLTRRNHRDMEWNRILYVSLRESISNDCSANA